MRRVTKLAALHFVAGVVIAVSSIAMLRDGKTFSGATSLVGAAMIFGIGVYEVARHKAD